MLQQYKWSMCTHTHQGFFLWRLPDPHILSLHGHTTCPQIDSVFPQHSLIICMNINLIFEYILNYTKLFKTLTWVKSRGRAVAGHFISFWDTHTKLHNFLSLTWHGPFKSRQAEDQDSHRYFGYSHQGNINSFPPWYGHTGGGGGITNFPPTHPSSTYFPSTGNFLLPFHVLVTPTTTIWLTNHHTSHQSCGIPSLSYGTPTMPMWYPTQGTLYLHPCRVIPNRIACGTPNTMMSWIPSFPLYGVTSVLNSLFHPTKLKQSWVSPKANLIKPQKW